MGGTGEVFVKKPKMRWSHGWDAVNAQVQVALLANPFHPMKINTLRLLFCACAFLLGILSPARALTIPASEDTTGYLNRITSFASNSSNLQVDPSRVAFLYFNLDDIPEGSVVKMARLRFYVPSIKAKGAGLGIHRVTGQWNEAIPGAQPGYETAPVAEIEASKLGSRRFMSVDVTSLVQDWINFTAENEGFAVTALSTGSARISPASVVISAKEGPALGLPALLDIELENVGESDAPISFERLPESVQALAANPGSFKLQTNEQLPDPLRVFLSPSITVQPLPPKSGGDLVIQAQGVGTLNYNWIRNGTLFSQGPDALIPSNQLRAGTYSVVVNNGFSTVTSGTVMVSNFVLVEAGTLPVTSGLGAVAVPSFYISKTEVTLKEWKDVRDWAVAHGYSGMKDVSGYESGIPVNLWNHPMHGMTWFDAVKWCNARSEKEGRTPVYTQNGSTYKTGDSIPAINTLANGYRLPSEAEWEFSARGGNRTKGYKFSGSGDIDTIAWWYGNSGAQSYTVATKTGNELGIFDMTGNAGEWCFDKWDTDDTRVFRGGHYYNESTLCSVDFRGSYDPYSTANIIGFRVAFNMEQMVLVSGGTLPASSALGAVSVNTFSIGKTEVTWADWKAVRDWAVANGYTDLADVGYGYGDNYPVTHVTWYDVVKWCNARSEMEGKMPVYTVNGTVFRNGNSIPEVNLLANGYRLPSESEWEFAARGGLKSRGYTYSGSNNLAEVAWYISNSATDSGYTIHEVGKKMPNELGIYDMSGNVFEWTFDAWGTNRVVRGGNWGDDGEYSAVARRHFAAPLFKDNDPTFRVAFSAAP
jgi:sulfatase modifying factor 1